jgi:hypothetical protein
LPPSSFRRRSCLLSLALLAHYLGTVATVSAHNPANHISRVSLLFACHLDVGERLLPISAQQAEWLDAVH